MTRRSDRFHLSTPQMPRMPQVFHIVTHARARVAGHTEFVRHPRHLRRPMVRRLQR